MKVTLEFDIHTENDESYELKRALHGLEYYLALCDIQQFIRKTASEMLGCLLCHPPWCVLAAMMKNKCFGWTSIL